MYANVSSKHIGVKALTVSFPLFIGMSNTMLSSPLSQNVRLCDIRKS